MGHIIHIASIIGVVACVHHFWPKGVTYGEREDWEKAYHRRHYIRRTDHDHAQGWYDDSEPSKSKSESKSKSKSRETSSSSSSSRKDRDRQTRRRDRDRDSKNDSDVSVRGRDIEYGAHPVYSRHASRGYRGRHSHEYEYEGGYEGGDEDRPPVYSSSRRASVRY